MKKGAGLTMRTRIPFDTEKERKPVKAYDWSFSWRQSAYIGIGLLAYAQCCQWAFIGAIGMMNLLTFLLLSPVLIIPVLCALVKNSKTGLFLDRHFWNYLNHHKQTGIWRKP